MIETQRHRVVLVLAYSIFYLEFISKLTVQNTESIEIFLKENNYFKQTL